MILGFTGTRKGMSERQMKSLGAILMASHYTRLHHGGCRGADEEAHKLFTMSKYHHGGRPHITVHPGPNGAHIKTPTSTDNELPIVEFRERKQYLERNDDIVAACDILVAAPENIQRDFSGTWATIRRGVTANKPVIILHP